MFKSVLCTSLYSVLFFYTPRLRKLLQVLSEPHRLTELNHQVAIKVGICGGVTNERCGFKQR